MGRGFYIAEGTRWLLLNINENFKNIPYKIFHLFWVHFNFMRAYNMYYHFFSQIVHLSNHFPCAITTSLFPTTSGFEYMLLWMCNFDFQKTQSQNYCSTIATIEVLAACIFLISSSTPQTCFLVSFVKRSGVINFQIKKKWLLSLLCSPKLISYFSLHLLNWPQLGLFFQ